MELKLPATQITSLAFGGPYLNILYVTTANKDGKQPEGWENQFCFFVWIMKLTVRDVFFFSSGYLYKVTGLFARGYAGVPLKLYESCKTLKITKNDKCYPFCSKWFYFDSTLEFFFFKLNSIVFFFDPSYVVLTITLWFRIDTIAVIVRCYNKS